MQQTQQGNKLGPFTHDHHHLCRYVEDANLQNPTMTLYKLHVCIYTQINSPEQYTLSAYQLQHTLIGLQYLIKQLM